MVSGILLLSILVLCFSLEMFLAASVRNIGIEQDGEMLTGLTIHEL
jgi:hypothetical protein